MGKFWTLSKKTTPQCCYFCNNEISGGIEMEHWLKWVNFKFRNSKIEPKLKA